MHFVLQHENCAVQIGPREGGIPHHNPFPEGEGTSARHRHASAFFTSAPRRPM